MTTCTPDKWIVIKLSTHNSVEHKVFGSWSGSYLEGSSWRMNSGITECVADQHDPDILNIKGYSGSTYQVHRDSYGVSAANAGILQSFIERALNSGLGQIDVLTEDESNEYFHKLKIK